MVVFQETRQARHLAAGAEQQAARHNLIVYNDLRSVNGQ
jgi:hypothetical protein